MAGLLSARGVAHQKRGGLGGSPAFDPGAEVLLWDTLGELPFLYPAADAAFVGGSLVPVGGHNLLEPAAQGVPVLWGPHAFQFREIARDLAGSGGGVQVADAGDLEAALGRWVGDPGLAPQAGGKARAFVQSQRGAAARTAQTILKLL